MKCRILTTFSFKKSSSSHNNSKNSMTTYLKYPIYKIQGSSCRSLNKILGSIKLKNPLTNFKINLLIIMTNQVSLSLINKTWIRNINFQILRVRLRTKTTPKTEVRMSIVLINLYQTSHMTFSLKTSKTTLQKIIKKMSQLLNSNKSFQVMDNNRLLVGRSAQWKNKWKFMNTMLSLPLKCN